MSTPPESDKEVPAPDVFSALCSSRGALQHLTGRWGSLAMVALLETNVPMRFAELRRKIDGISDRMLSQTLSQLERDGMLNRTVRSSIPPHVDYSLTDLGLEIAQPLAALTSLVESRLAEVVKAQELYDAQQG